MSRRNKLGAVSSKWRPNSEGEALSSVVLAAPLKTGIRDHFWAITCLTGVGLCINATDTSSTVQTHLQPNTVQLLLHTSPFHIYFSRALQGEELQCLIKQLFQ